MAIISEETLKERLENPSNIVNVLHKGLHNGGRKEGDLNRSVDFRALAGFLAHLEPAKEVAENLGMSPSAVHNYKHGRNGNGLPSSELAEKIDEKLGRVNDKALTKLLASVELIDLTKPKEAKLKSSIAKDLASVVERTGAKKTEQTGVNFIVYSTQAKQESSYEIIEVNAQ